MGVDRQSPTLFGLPAVLPPNLSPGDEESLLRREIVDDPPPGRVGGEPTLERLVGEADAPEVGDVLPEGQLTVDVHSGQRLLFGILRDDLLGPGVELTRICVTPPIGQVALRVEPAALVVVSVR